MAIEPTEILSAEAQLALAHTRPKMRDALRIFLEFDARLARIVAGTSEPMLGQIRLAWWRDALGQPPEARPAGDAVLDAIGVHWCGRETALIALVDGWEQALEEPPLSEKSARLFAQGRCAALLAAHGSARGEAAAREGVGDALHTAAWRWSLADFAASVSREDERALLVRIGLGDGPPNPRLGPEARGLAVLGALGLRALKRGGRPLMEGRGAAFTALRASVFGA